VYRRHGGNNPCIIDLTLNVGEWSASYSSRIIPGKAKQNEILHMALYEGMYV
jgi:hypothetical protein